MNAPVEARQLGWPRHEMRKVSDADWLAEAPSHWQTKRLRFALSLGPSPKECRKLDGGTEVSFIPMDAVGEQGRLRLDASKPLSESSAGYVYFRNGDVVVAKITPCFENGKGALAAGLINGVAFGTTELHVLRAHAGALDPQFLFYLTASQPFRRLGEASMYGAGGQKRVPEEFIKDFRPALPPPPEQRSIASFLDRETARLDGLIEKRRHMIALLQERRAALITHAVTRGLDPDASLKDSGIEWLGQIPAHWVVAPVAARYEVQLGKMLDEKRILGTTLAPYLRNVDVQWESINTDDLPTMDFSERDRKKFSLHSGDLLVCEGGDVGRTAIWSGKLGTCFFQKALHRLRPSRPTEEEPRFMRYLMYWTAGRGLFTATGNANTIDHLTADKLRRHRFGFPPRDEQRRIADFLDAQCSGIDSMQFKLERALSALTEYRTSLITAAVTGQIDVRGLVTP